MNLNRNQVSLIRLRMYLHVLEEINKHLNQLIIVEYLERNNLYFKITVT